MTASEQQTTTASGGDVEVDPDHTDGNPEPYKTGAAKTDGNPEPYKTDGNPEPYDTPK